MCTPHGEVTKWLKVSDLKSDRSRKRREGSNPSFSAFSSLRGCTIKYIYFTLEKYPSWPKGHPWKGCRSLIAARGFKSHLLREKREPVRLSFFAEKTDREASAAAGTCHSGIFTHDGVPSNIEVNSIQAGNFVFRCQIPEWRRSCCIT